jgi:hypothetical protein
LEDLGVHGRILLCILNKYSKDWTGLIWLRIGTDDAVL